jgi:hypothetical protein
MNPKRKPPPPVIDAARVISYAFVGDIPYLPAGIAALAQSEDQSEEQVTRLAIAVGLSPQSTQEGPVVFHCDEAWISVGVSSAPSIEGAKEVAECNYPGVGNRWIDTNVSVEEALAFYDSETAGLKCSFCGKRPFEVAGMIEGPQATICRECVEEFYGDFQTEEDDDVGN